MGGMSERGKEREGVRRASAPAVCRYFYQHELGKGRRARMGEEEEEEEVREEVLGGGQEEGRRQNVGEMDKCGGDAERGGGIVKRRGE